MQNEDTGSSSTPLDSHIRTRPFTTIDRLKGLPGYYFTPPTSGSVTPASIPPTPPLNEDANGRLSRAIMSFENLVALANHQERIKGAKKMVWRDKGQPVVELDTFKRCLTHALSGGLREAFSCRKFDLHTHEFSDLFTRFRDTCFRYSRLS